MDKIEQRRREILHEICEVKGDYLVVKGGYLVTDNVLLGSNTSKYRLTRNAVDYKYEVARRILQIKEPTLDLCWLIKNEKVEIEDKGWIYRRAVDLSKISLSYKGVSIDLSLFNFIERDIIDFYLSKYIEKQHQIKLKKQLEEKEVKRQELTQLLTQQE